MGITWVDSTRGNLCPLLLRSIVSRQRGRLVCFTRKPSCTRAYVLKGQSDSSICHLQFWRRSSSSLRLAPSIMRNAKSGVPAQSSVTVVLENFMFSPKTRLSSLPPRSHQSERQKRGTKPKRRMGQVPPWLPTQMSAKNKN